jgi:hypothetical protein
MEADDRLVHKDIERAEALAICALFRRIEENESATVVWQDWQEDVDLLVLREVRAALERGLARERDDAQLELTRSQALVLGDWLWRMEQGNDLAPLLAEDGSEQSALWTLDVWLELELFAEYSDRDYAALVKAARERVKIDYLSAN